MLPSLVLQNGQLDPLLQRQYWDDGYLFPLPGLSREEALTYRAEIEAIEEEWLDNGLPLPLNTYKRINAHLVMPMVAQIAMHPAILDVVEGILGPDIMVFSGEFFIKEPRTRQIVSMHQDLTYWGLGAIDGLVTAWIPLSPATPASGCMDFVRASHKNAILPHEDTFDANNLLSRGQEVKVDVPDDQKTTIEIHPGQMSLHHGLTIHGSGPNTSDDRRIACVIRYIRPDMKQQVGDKDYAMLARGEDRHGNFIHVPPPSTNFAPEAMALYEEIRIAQSKVMMRGATGKTEMYT
ncbi:MAG: phytanoyl-CoA dioxygenase family protein [Yoonia sp.]|uniref:phytanoyl-CoA dioxygenase family protein n=1 Tax=Yoonia sp. TaxID=2212373 RepID=UPI00273D7288|nr:phytanoyl-CoA dioxygenase family protein [Yoonia sp.]MDP5085186.1 phytanoyl-CoA dioxygenase family protein [Yoonia sp.]